MSNPYLDSEFHGELAMLLPAPSSHVGCEDNAACENEIRADDGLTTSLHNDGGRHRQTMYIFLTLVLSFTLVGVIGYSSSSSSSVWKLKRDVENLTTYLAHGEIEVKSGCVNLYGSDPKHFRETAAYQICNDEDVDTTKIGDVGFSSSDQNHGISFVETGDNAAVNVCVEKSSHVSFSSHHSILFRVE